MSDGRMQVLSFFLRYKLSRHVYTTGCADIRGQTGMSREAPCAARGGSADTGRIAEAAAGSEAIRSLYVM